jgi:hypothetical protein
MNYPEIAAADLLDTVADQLFRYCWSLLRSRETAQIALRDTLRAATARPAGADMPGSRLYALARAECARHPVVPSSDADEAPACLGPNDSDPRVVAWNAALSLDPAEFEALELAIRHDVDLAQVLGLPDGEAQALLARARQNLERALVAEMLARRGHACPDRAEVLAGWTGTMTPRIRDRILEHAAACRSCRRNKPGNVSASRVFAVLPAPALTPEARAGLRAALTPAAQDPAPTRPEPRSPAGLPAAPAPAQAAAPAPAGLPAAPAPAGLPAAPAPAGTVPPPVNLPLAALVQPPPSVAPLAWTIPSPPPDAPRASAAPPREPAAPPSPRPGPAPRLVSSPSRPSAPQPGARRRRRGGLMIAGAGVVVSAVVIASAVAVSGRSGRPAELHEVTPTMAAAAPTGSGPQAAGLGSAGPVSSRRGGAARPRLYTPPPLVGTAGSKNRVLITAATRPLLPSPAPQAVPQTAPSQPSGSSASGPPAVPGTLELSAGVVDVGAGPAGQITLTAAGGPVTWSASSSAPDQVSLSSDAGTLQPGQSVTLTVTVARGRDPGNADLLFEPPASAPQVVQVTWEARPYPRRPHMHRGPYDPPPAPPAPPSQTASPSPSSS